MSFGKANQSLPSQEVQSRREFMAEQLVWDQRGFLPAKLHRHDPTGCALSDQASRMD